MFRKYVLIILCFTLGLINTAFYFLSSYYIQDEAKELYHFEQYNKTSPIPPIKEVIIVNDCTKEWIHHHCDIESCNTTNSYNYNPCMYCFIKEGCIYGELSDARCTDICNNTVEGKKAICRYCYQTNHWEHSCMQKTSCPSISTPRRHYKTNCTVHSDVICLGNRQFPKKLKCNWTKGYRWSTALMLSITLGGFGADRFYLGHWQEGVGKLFSFGGLGVWTLVDILLIAIRYLGPEDGSLYM